MVVRLPRWTSEYADNFTWTEAKAAVTSQNWAPVVIPHRHHEPYDLHVTPPLTTAITTTTTASDAAAANQTTQSTVRFEDSATAARNEVTAQRTQTTTNPPPVIATATNTQPIHTLNSTTQTTTAPAETAITTVERETELNTQPPRISTTETREQRELRREQERETAREVERQRRERYKTPQILPYGAGNTRHTNDDYYMKTFNVKVPPGEVMPYTTDRVKRLKEYQVTPLQPTSTQSRWSDALDTYYRAARDYSSNPNRFTPVPWTTEYRREFVDWTKSAKIIKERIVARENELRPVVPERVTVKEKIVTKVPEGAVSPPIPPVTTTTEEIKVSSPIRTTTQPLATTTNTTTLLNTTPARTSKLPSTEIVVAPPITTTTTTTTRPAYQASSYLRTTTPPPVTTTTYNYESPVKFVERVLPAGLPEPLDHIHREKRHYAEVRDHVDEMFRDEAYNRPLRYVPRSAWRQEKVGVDDSGVVVERKETEVVGGEVRKEEDKTL
ncbi:hypothetical protein HK097_000449, partial [Rhizophlyctis rosea]